VTAPRRWGEAPRPPGRPALDPRVRAVVFRLREEDPSLGVRLLAARVEAETGTKVSRETVRKLLRSAEQVAAYAAEPPGVGVVGQGRGLTAWDRAMATAMSEADHAAFDAYRAPASTYWWTFRPSPDKWWVYP
jgi:Homeodomain-like domain